MPHMAGRKGKGGADPFAEKLEAMQSTVADMVGVCKPLAEDLLEAYVKVYGDYVELDRVLKLDGLIIDKEVGAANNRRVDMVKHPAFDMRRNCINQMADLANKIKRFVKDDTGVQEDDFDAF